MLVLQLGVAVLVYRDARSHSSQSAALWGLVVTVGGLLLGPLLYVLLGRDEPSSSPNRRRRRRSPSIDSSDEPMNVDDSGPF